MTIRKLLLIIFFFFFLFPISINGISVNYSFLIIPLFYLCINYKLVRPAKLFLIIIGLFTLIFVIASIYQYDFYDKALQRITSFIIFMSIFSYAFVKIDSEMIESFKISIIATGLFFSIFSWFSYYILSGSAGFDAKNMVGGQRYGFIYLIGIWLTYLYPSGKKKLHLLIKYTALLILLVGLFLTFSRSSIVGLLGSFGIFIMFNSIKWFKRPAFKTLLKSVVLGVAVFSITLILYKVIPVAFNFFNERLFLFLADSTAVKENIINPAASIGTRFYVAHKIFDFLLNNPLNLLFGSGYLGVWIFSDPLFGSAHNQYTDVLFRTGLLGFTTYIYMILLLIKYLYRNQRALFWSLISVLIYGIFNETFKESQGGFVLAFLTGMMSQSFHKRKLTFSLKNDMNIGEKSNRLTV